MNAWRERNFRRLFIGQAVSALGNTFVPVALAFAVLDLTHSASDVGYVFAANSICLILFLLIGGVVADRLPRRALMIAADVVRCLAQLALGVLLVTSHPLVITIALLGAVMGTATALFTPAATGLTPLLLPPEYLQQANALQQSANAAAGIAGPAVAGVLVVTVSPGWAIIADAATFLVSVVFLTSIRFGQIPRSERKHWMRDLRDGWTDFWRRRWFRTAVLGSSAFNLLYATYFVLGPVASRIYYGGAGAWATIATATAIGSLAASLAAAKLRLHHPLRTGLAFVMLAALAPLAFAASLPVAFIAVAAAFGGAGLITFESLWQTSVQRSIPEAMLSRASSYDYFGSLITFPIGLAIAGPLAALDGPRLVLLSAGVLEIVLLLATLLTPAVFRHVDSQEHPVGRQQLTPS